jgi:hypothetical protein
MEVNDLPLEEELSKDQALLKMKLKRFVKHSLFLILITAVVLTLRNLKLLCKVLVLKKRTQLSTQ